MVGRNRAITVTGFNLTTKDVNTVCRLNQSHIDAIPNCVFSKIGFKQLCNCGCGVEICVLDFQNQCVTGLETRYFKVLDQGIIKISLIINFESSCYTDICLTRIVKFDISFASRLQLVDINGAATCSVPCTCKMPSFA